MTARKRRGRWTYVDHPMNGPRWRLDGTTLDLEFDNLDSGGSLRGAWHVWIDGRPSLSSGVDHYLDGSMQYVENAVDNEGPFAGAHDQPWAVAARAQLLAGAA